MPDIDFSDVAKTARPKARRPFESQVTSDWGAPRPYGGHTGLDFRYAEGEPVGALSRGRVRRVVRGHKGYGNFVEIEDASGTLHGYAHLNDTDLKEGDEIDEGDQIGLAGNTGYSKGPHLHYWQRVGGVKVKPAPTRKGGAMPVAPPTGGIDFSDVAAEGLPTYAPPDVPPATTPRQESQLTNARAGGAASPAPPPPPQTLPVVMPSAADVRRGGTSVDEFAAQVAGINRTRKAVEEQIRRHAPNANLRWDHGADSDVLTPGRLVDERGRVWAEFDGGGSVNLKVHGETPRTQVTPAVRRARAALKRANDEYRRVQRKQQAISAGVRTPGVAMDDPEELRGDPEQNTAELKAALQRRALARAALQNVLRAAGSPRLNSLAPPETRTLALRENAPDTSGRARAAELGRTARVTAEVGPPPDLDLPDAYEQFRAAPTVENAAAVEVENARRSAAAVPGVIERLRAAGAGTGRRLTAGDKWEEIKQDPSKLLPFVSSFGNFLDLGVVMDAAKRVQSGRGNDDDAELLRLFADHAGQESTTPYKIAAVLSELPSFVGELALTGGAYTAGKRVATKGATEAAERLLSQAARDAGARALTRPVVGKAAELAAKTGQVAAGAATQLPLAGPTRILAGAQRGRLEKFFETGEDEGLAAALPEAVADQYIELLSERAGGALKYLPVPQRLRALKAGLAKRWLGAGEGRTLDGLNEFLNRAGWNGVVGEVFEERVGGAARSAIGLQPWSEAVPSLEQLVVEGVAFSVPGAGIALGKRAAGAVAPVPESPDTLRSQYRSALDPASPRAAVLVTPGEEVKPRRGFAVLDIPGTGQLHVSRAKMKAMGLDTPAAITGFIEENGFEPLIGKVAPVEDTSQGLALRTEDADGRELSTSVVPTEADAKAQAVVDLAQFPEAARQEVLPAPVAAVKRAEEVVDEPRIDFSDVAKTPDRRTVQTFAADSGAAAVGAVGTGARAAEDAGRVGDVEARGGVDAASALARDAAPADAVQSVSEEVEQYDHRDLGRVTVAGKSRKRADGREVVPVVDEAGESHEIIKSDGNGRGNHLAIPVRRQGIRITPKAATAGESNATEKGIVAEDREQQYPGIETVGQEAVAGRGDSVEVGGQVEGREAGQVAARTRADAVRRHLDERGLKDIPVTPEFVEVDPAQGRAIGQDDAVLTPSAHRQSPYIVIPDESGRTGWAYPNPRGGSPESAAMMGWRGGDMAGRPAVREAGGWRVPLSGEAPARPASASSAGASTQLTTSQLPAQPRTEAGGGEVARQESPVAARPLDDATLAAMPSFFGTEKSDAAQALLDSPHKREIVEEIGPVEWVSRRNGDDLDNGSPRPYEASALYLYTPKGKYALLMGVRQDAEAINARGGEAKFWGDRNRGGVVLEKLTDGYVAPVESGPAPASAAPAKPRRGTDGEGERPTPSEAGEDYFGEDLAGKWLNSSRRYDSKGGIVVGSVPASEIASMEVAFEAQAAPQQTDVEKLEARGFRKVGSRRWEREFTYAQPAAPKTETARERRERERLERRINRNPRKARGANAKRDSLHEWVALSGGIRPSKAYDTAALRGMRYTVRPLVSERGEDAERMMQSAIESGYLAGRAQGYGTRDAYDSGAFSLDDFIQAVADDYRAAHGASTLPRLYSTENPAFEDAAEFGEVSEEEERLLEQEARFLQDPDARRLLEDLELTGEITSDARAELAIIGDTYGLPRDLIDATVGSLREIALARLPAETEAEGVGLPAESEPGIFVEEVGDAYEPEGDVDTSFDFADEEAPAPASQNQPTPTPDLSRAEQSGFGFGVTDSGLFSEGGPTPVDAPAPGGGVSGAADKERIKSDLLAKQKGADAQKNAEAFGQVAARTIERIALGQGRAAAAAKHLIAERGEVNARGLEGALIAQSAAQVLDEYDKAESAGQSVADYLAQDDLFGNKPKLAPKQLEFLAALEKGTFSDAFGKTLARVGRAGAETAVDAGGRREENPSDAERGGANLERDSRGGPDDAIRQAVLPAGRGGDVAAVRPRDRDARSGELQPDGGARVLGSGPAPAGARGDQRLRGEASSPESGPAGDTDRAGGDSLLDEPAPPDDRAAAAVRDSATGPQQLAEKRAAQLAANSLQVEPGDLANVRETLPFLMPEQHEDVLFAEQRFAKPDGYGVLFTNGTGTGKTYTGLGLVRRFVSQGKDNILILAPGDGVAKAWAESGANLGLDIKRLADTDDNGGSGVAVTTYANFYQNDSLVRRDWDLIVADESHYLGSNQGGDLTKAAQMLRAITLHPDALYTRATLLRPDLYEALAKAREAKDDAAARAAQATITDHEQAVRAAATPDKRTRVAFLSATPFAYRKNVRYAQGYLFDWNQGFTGQRGGYNQPDAEDAFFIRHFGYKMRYGRLEEPDPEVNTDLMEQTFNTWLKKEGALSGRTLQVEADYDRKFVLVEDAVGRKIDEGIDFLYNGEGGKYWPLAEHFRKQFDYLQQRFLLEAIKARHAVKVAREHLALGRKVVIFHDYNVGGGRNPFHFPKADTTITYTARGGARVTTTMRQLAADFEAARPDLVSLDFGRLAPAKDQLGAAFPDALYYNGTETKSKNREAIDLFNRDGSGRDVLVVQTDKGKEGISLHDTTGKHQRVIVNLGLPVRPTTAIQQEGRIYRVGQVTDAVFRYFNTGTGWERTAFARTIAQRAATAENLGMGEEARALKAAYIDSFNDSDIYPASMDEGRGGKASDRSRTRMTPFARAKTFYYAQQKKTSKTKAQEGVDYFATPEPLALKMVEWADIRPNEKVLEPSAGHGAIARFFPEYADRHMIEPSSELSSRAELVSGARLREERTFEELHLVNKYDAVVMNPPFGHGGATAMRHVAKAFQHLKDGGRVVALIPTGPAADRALDKLYDSDEAKGVYKVATIRLPRVTFERAGTSVAAQVVVFEKQTRDENARRLQEAQRDYSDAEDINNFFDRIEEASIPERLPVPEEGTAETPLTTEAAEEGAQVGTTADAGAGTGRFNLAETTHTKTGEPLFVATFSERVEGDEYQSAKALAKRHGGWYSSFRGAGAIPGFQFKSEEARANFLRASDPQIVGSGIEGAPVASPLYAASAGEKRLDDLRDTDFANLLPAASVRRDDHLLEVNAEGHEILRRAFEQNLINRGETEGEPESPFDGVFLNPGQIKDTVRSLKSAAAEMRSAGYTDEEAARLDSFAADLVKAGRAGKGTAIAFVFDEAVPHEEFHRAGFQGAVEEALSSRHARFSELAGHSAVRKAWANYFNRVSGYTRSDEAVLVEETAAWIAGGKAETLGLTEEEAAEYLDLWFESYAERNGDAALENFVERGLPHVREIIGQLRARRADGQRSQGRDERSRQGVPREPEEDAGGETEGDQGRAQKGSRGQGVRSLPSTLRTQGLAAADELYEIYSDKAATADAKRLLETFGFDGSIQLLKSERATGAEHVQLSKILQRALLNEAARVSETDAEEAARLRTIQQDLASTLAAQMTRAGQYVHSAGVIDSNVEDVMAAAARVARERGRELSPREAERVHAAGEELERSTAELEVAASVARDAREQVAADAETLKRAEEGALTKRQIKALRERLASLRAKERNREQRIAELEGQLPRKVRKPTAQRPVRERAAELLAVDEDALMESLRASFGSGSPLYQTAWHGSPHQFDRFSTEKIGTGEGAQAYGHGLYFTDKREIAEHYKTQLGLKNAGSEALVFGGTPARKVLGLPPLSEDNARRLLAYQQQGYYLSDVERVTGNEPELAAYVAALRQKGISDFGLRNPEAHLSLDVPVTSLSDAERSAWYDVTGRYHWKRNNADPLGAIRAELEKTVDVQTRNLEYYKEHPTWGNPDEARRVKAEAEAALKLLDTHKVEIEQPLKLGALYRVDLAPKEDEYLLWDKPLSEQSEKVKAALRGAGYEVPERRKLSDRQIVDLGRRFLTSQRAQELWAEDIGIRDAMRPAVRAFEAGESEFVKYARTNEGQQFFDRYIHKTGAKNPTGEIFYRELQFTDAGVRGRQENIGQRGASARLHELGVRGIKYLAGDSRAQGEGSYNYVIFDEADVTIEEILKMARAEGDVSRPATAPRALTPEQLDQLAQVGALRLLRAERGKLTVSDFKRQMAADFGPAVRPHLDAIHAASVNLAKETIRRANRERTLDAIAEREGNEDLTREELEAIADEEAGERKRASLVRAEHDRAAREFARSQKSDVERIAPALANAIARNAATDEEAKAAALLSLPGMDAARFARETGLSGKELRDRFAAGGRVLEAARRDIRDSRDIAAALKETAAQTEADRDRALASLMQARRKRGDSQRKVALELKKIKKGALRTAVGAAWSASKGIPISLMASGDFSHLLRQGGIGVAMKPSLAPAFAKATLKGIRDAGHAKNVDSIEQDEDFALMQRMKVDFAFAGGSGNVGEEFFEGNEVLQRIPIVGAFVRKSDQTFGGGLDHLRAALAKLWIQELRANGVTFEKNPRAYEDVGRFINIITGRADIGDHNTAATRAYLSLGRMIGFAPRYRISRLQFITLPFNSSFWNADPAARRIVYKNVARWYGTVGATFGALTALGWATSQTLVQFFDPDDDDWLKLKIGKQRIDLTSGNQTHARAVFRMLVEGYRGLSGQVTGRMAFDQMLGGGTDSVLGRWIWSGSDPRASLAIEAFTGETYDRQPFSWFGDYGIDGAIGSRLIPITYSNFAKTYGKEGATYAATQGAAEFVGLNSNVYPDRADEPKTTGEKLALRFSMRDFGNRKPLDEATKRKLDDLKKRARGGEDVEAELAPLVATETITEKRADAIANARNQTFLQEKFRLLTLDDAKHVLKYLTPAEKAQVAEIVKRKELSAAEKRRKVEEDLANRERAKIKREKSRRAKDRRERRQELRYGGEVRP